MSDWVTFADRLSATGLSDEWSRAGRSVERLFPFFDVAITMTLPLGETAGERPAIRANEAPCGAKDAERRAPGVEWWRAMVASCGRSVGRREQVVYRSSPVKTVRYLGFRADNRDISLTRVEKSAGGGRWVRSQAADHARSGSPAERAIGGDGLEGRDCSDVRCGSRWASAVSRGPKRRRLDGERRRPREV